MKASRFLPWILLVFTASPGIAGSEAPKWLQDAARTPTPSDVGRAPAVELLRETSVEADAAGNITTLTRRALRILTSEGRDEAIAAETYIAGSGDVRELSAWVLDPSGKCKIFGKKETLELAAADNDVYGETRVKAIHAGGDAVVGSVFGWESLTAEKAFCAQLRWAAQDRLPVVVARLTLTTPQGWSVRPAIFNHDRIDPRVEPPATTWTFQSLPYLEAEVASPPVSSLAPWIAVSVVPPSGLTKGSGSVFQDWNDVSHWIRELAAPQAKVSPALQAKAIELTRTLAGERDRIDAIARYVQAINYISIQTGLGVGGGYRPHPAVDVFSKSYGDCKDKANLMHTMLGVIGVPSELVLIRADDRNFVREEWPSPFPFNHCIVAIAVSDTFHARSVIRPTASTRWLLFDPTDPFTVLGDLPSDEQGSLALVTADRTDGGGLFRVPSFAEDEQTARRVEGTVGEDGSLKARLTVTASGQSAATLRSAMRLSSPADYRKQMETSISEALPSAKISSLQQADDLVRNEVRLDVDFSVADFARPMPGRLLALRPAVMPGAEPAFDDERPRQLPILLDGGSVTEVDTLRLPSGFSLEDRPDSLRVETQFGRFRSQFSELPGALCFTRELVLKRTTLPPDAMASVAKFFDQVRSAEQVSVVLKPR